MSVSLLRTRAMRNGKFLHVNDNGKFFASGDDFVDRSIAGKLAADDIAFLKRKGHRFEIDDAIGSASHLFNLAQRWSNIGELDYLILVPTLRCNLSCSYCQVSRVAEKSVGFDWDDSTLSSILTLLDGLPTVRIKIEFQGGEPTLRPDLIEAVIERCQRFEQRQFVICTNLQHIDDDIWRMFDNPELYISTSLDGTFSNHARQRTGDATDRFRSNLEAIIARYGPNKVSALPTIDTMSPPPIDDVIDTFASLGLDSIFLRPINYQGFARKRHSHSKELDSAWTSYHRAFVERIIEKNWEDRTRVLEEAYMSICLRRIFQPNADRHVDLRNPNPLAVDYIVIDHDGIIYPTDEARMLARSGIIDLSLGKVGEDWKGEKWSKLNEHCSNIFDSACTRCTYQPFCGRDVVDDLARYGTIDLPRTDTAYCQRHMTIFDFIFELLYRDDDKTRYSLSRWLRLDGTAFNFGDYLV